MPTHTITRAFLDDDVPHRGDRYEFAERVERFEGVVRDVVPDGEKHHRVTLNMTTAEHERMLAAQR